MSTLKVETIQNTSALYSSTPHQIEQGRAKAHIQMKGTGTITINSSFNISSIYNSLLLLFLVLLLVLLVSNYPITRGVIMLLLMLNPPNILQTILSFSVF